MGMAEVSRWNNSHQSFFDGAGSGPRGETCTVGDAKNMGVDGDCFVAKDFVEDNVRGLAPYPWQRLQ